MVFRKFFCIVFFAVVLSCNNQPVYPKAENALDAGREFIDGCLKGNFSKAGFYMLDDKENTQKFLQLQMDYKSKDNTDREQYKNASIIIDQEETLSDTVEIIHYRNSFDRVARKVKVVLHDGTWLVDFKYTFDGNL